MEMDGMSPQDQVLRQSATPNRRPIIVE